MPNFDDVPRALKSTPQEAFPKKHGQMARLGLAHKQAAGILAILVLACLGLTACGGGSSGSSSNAAATGRAATSSAGASSTGGSSTQSTAPGATHGRFATIRECLQKNGVTLPKRTPGSGGAVGGGFPGAGGGPVLPKGMTRTQFEAALKKCGGGNFGARFGRSGGPGFGRANSPVFEAALTKYAACLRQNGIAIPAPNTSGKGPIFSTKGINTASPQFKAATMKCRASLIGAFRRPQGGGASGTTTNPPASGTAGGQSSG